MSASVKSSVTTPVDDAREWLLDCFSDGATYIGRMDDAEIVAAVNTHYIGGWDRFMHDG